MSQASTARNALKRIWTSSIPKLKQGSTLSIKASVPLTRVEIQSAWQDDGRATLRQTESPSMPFVQMSISQEDDQMTSLERLEPHWKISLDAQKDSSHNDGDVALGDLPSQGDGDDDDDESVLMVEVPEKLNLVCNLEHGGNIVVSNKIEGDVQLSTTNGNVRVKKLRGHEIRIESESNQQNDGGHIHATDLVEAQEIHLETKGGRIRAKQIHGTSIQLFATTTASTDDTANHTSAPSSMPFENDDEGSLIDVSSLYVSGMGGATAKVENAPLLNRRAVRIKTCQGPVRVETRRVGRPSETNPLTTSRDSEQELYPLVELGGVNGNCEVEIQQSSTDSTEDQSHWTSCNVHVDSLAAESVSLVSTDTGNVQLTMDRKVESDIRLLSLPSVDDTKNEENPPFLVESVALLSEEEDPKQVVNILKHLLPDGQEHSDQGMNHKRISVETRAFTARYGTEQLVLGDTGSSSRSLEYMDGWVDNKSSEPDSRFDTKLKREAIGLHHSRIGGGKIRLESAADQALFGFGGEDKKDDGRKDDGASVLRPLFAVVGTCKIKLETLSWLGAIARRYGMEGDEHRGLGRQATRRGRSLSDTSHSS